MDPKGRNLGGRAYLVLELGKHGLSRRRALRVLNLVFREMGLALRRGEYVECPFGYLKAEKRVSQRWQAIGDEPMRPYFVRLIVDEEGERLFEGEERTPWPLDWSRKPDKNSLVHRWDRSLKRSGKRTGIAGKSPRGSRDAANKSGRSGK